MARAQSHVGLSCGVSGLSCELSGLSCELSGLSCGVSGDCLNLGKVAISRSCRRQVRTNCCLSMQMAADLVAKLAEADIQFKWKGKVETCKFLDEV